MLCPKDNVVCDLVVLQDIEIDVCPQCQGVWLEQSEVHKLVRHLSMPDNTDIDELLAEWNVAEHEGTAPKDFWVEGKLICPNEGAQMQKHYFAGSHIGVDHCLICKGFWFDGGELQAVADLAKPDQNKELLGMGLACIEGLSAAQKMASYRPNDNRVSKRFLFSPVFMANTHPAFALLSMAANFFLDWLRSDR